VQAKQNKEFTPSFPLAGRCSDISRRAGLYHTQQLPGRTHTITLNVPPFFLLPPAFPGEHSVVGDFPLVSWGQLSWLRPLPASCPASAYSLAGKREKERRPEVVQALLSNN